MKSGFTLIEILVALVIVGILVGTAAVSLGAGVKSAQMADATRAVQQYAGHARAIALLKQRPVVLTIEEIVEDGVFVKSRVSTSYSKDASAGGEGVSHGAGFGAAGSGQGGVVTLAGLPVDGEDAGAAEAEDEDDPLSPEPRDFEGLHIKGELKEDLEKKRSRISVYSNVDTLRRQNREQQEKAKAKLLEENGVAADGTDPAAEEQTAESSFSVVYEPNGRCDPYFVKIWKDGTDEAKAVSLEVGRFGRVVEDEE